MSNDLQKNRIEYYDYLRVFATFSVVVIHIISRVWYSAEIGTFEWYTINVFFGCARWSVPVFVMISGALFLNSSKPFISILKTNALRLITAFAFWSFLYAVYDYISGQGLLESIGNFFKGRYHMWFVFMILGLYFIIPFLRVIIKNEKLTKYFIFLSLFSAIIIPQFVSIISIFLPSTSSVLESIVHNTFFYFPLGYSGYFVLGFYLSKKEIHRHWRLVLYIIGIFSVVFTIVFSLLYSAFIEKTEMFFDYLTLNVFGVSIAVFVFVKNHKFKANSVLYRIIKNVSNHCFGIYLIHVFFVNFISNKLHIHALSYNPIIVVPCASIAVFIVSFIIIFLIRRIPQIGRYIT